ncbi:hypothetical protein CKO44_08915 [Rubrivivax gelatinosus]|uniref:Lipocalin-like domain-containing protein n=1 Tax=Rubrivivax gelatinosus TaxID=28068 RepID=A0ABS1DRP6_RUBGE|nr:lipocalin-like domain-containing protein [Rubrivivax gelatinosus]MBK1613591.1 hypothetical protein [Rubrivivax gelatinosus]MBK1712677.1 hypothetical protein [Rubrivivax gelatinosus]
MQSDRRRLISKTLAGAALAAAFCAPGVATAADEAPAILGTWRLVSYVVEVQQTGEIMPVMGAKPSGGVDFTPNGRVFFMLTADGRKPGKTEAEKAALLDTIVSYTGRAEIKGDQWTTHVEAAWNPAWVGTAQTRNFKVDGDKLQVTTPWRVMPNWADKGMTRSLIMFERQK